jgi:lipopolysaccharide/colanic/teichoic acid biosynthesis glycosyltransferase
MKRLFDTVASAIGLLLCFPVFLVAGTLIWLQDFCSPFYVATRIGLKGKPFQMLKLRSMVVNADRIGVDSTSANDPRITQVGHFIRRYKLDELSQLWNVLKGEMSLVGPRPNVRREVNLYTSTEMKLLSVKPGITDISSIVFSDLGEILRNHSDPDIAYNQLVRPWKSRLSLIYIENQSFILDIKLILITVMSIFSRRLALREVTKILVNLQVDRQLIQIASRQTELYPFPPPGATEIVISREHVY